MALIPGNLISENNQSVETSVGGWGSFQTVSSSIVQSTSQAFDGTHSVASTASATSAGALAGLTTTVDLPVVSAGTAYVWTYFVRPPVGATFNANLDWYQSNNTTFISSTNSPGQFAPANVWTPITLPSAIAPALAGVARLYLQVTSGLSIGNVVFFDQMFFGSPQIAFPDLDLTPGRDSVDFMPWFGAPDSDHSVIVNAGTASITFETPTFNNTMLLLALASESGMGARSVHADDPDVVLDPLLLPGDVTGGMPAWGGVPDLLAAPAVSVTAGVASVSFVAQGPSAGLAALPGTGSLTFTAQGPTAAVGALPGAASVTVVAQAPAVGLTALPGAAAVTLAGQQPTVGIAPTAGAASVTFTARDALAGPGGSAGAASITFAARDASVGISPVAGVASVTLTAQAPAAALATLPGAAAVSFTAQSATAALGSLPGVASIITAVAQDTGNVGALPGAAPINLSALIPALVITEGQVDLSVPAFLPDDPFGGMIPWAGATDGIITGDAAVAAGVATISIFANQPVAGLGALPGVSSMSVVAQSASTGLSALPGTGSITLTANGPQAAVGALPGASSVVFSGRSPIAGAGALPGASSITFTGQSALAGPGGTPGAASITFTARAPVAGLAALPGASLITFAGQAPMAGLAALPGASSIVFTARDVSVPGQTTANAGVATITMTASGPVAGVSPVAGVASVVLVARPAQVSLAASPGVAVVAVAALGALSALPQSGTPTVISGRQPLGQLYGRESITSASGSETGGISGRQPLSSTSGNEPGSSIKGKEA